MRAHRKPGSWQAWRQGRLSKRGNADVGFFGPENFIIVVCTPLERLATKIVEFTVLTFRIFTGKIYLYGQDLTNVSS
jgi:hypothetical protein